MTYPQQPGYPQAPQQYAPPMPQQPQQFAPPNQYPQHQQGYPTAPAPQYAPPQQFQQPYYPPQQPVAPPQPVNASLDDFYNQPSSGWGPGLPWKGMPINTSYTLITGRAVTKADVEHQTKFGSDTELAYYRDGRPVLVMKVPGNLQPSQSFPDGRGQWYVSGKVRDELTRAMNAVGADGSLPPEVGSYINVTLTGKQPNKFGTESMKMAVVYMRPSPEIAAWAAQNGIEYPNLSAAAAPAAAPEPIQQPAPAPVQQAPAQPQFQAPVPPVAAPQVPAAVAQAPMAPPMAPPVLQQPAAPQVPAAAAAPPAPSAAALANATPEQQALLAGLGVTMPG